MGEQADDENQARASQDAETGQVVLLRQDHTQKTSQRAFGHRAKPPQHPDGKYHRQHCQQAAHKDSSESFHDICRELGFPSLVVVMRLVNFESDATSQLE